MPHVIVKMYPGRSEEKKKELTARIVESVVAVTECPETAVSVTIEEIEQEVWPETVYRPDILEGSGTLYKKPGYNPFEKAAEDSDPLESLAEYVRDAAARAMQEDTTGYFNPMSWLDLELEDNPGGFDAFFNKPWNELSDSEKADRAMAIRRVL